MNAPYSPKSTATAIRPTVVDVLADGSAEVSVRWPASGPATRTVEESTAAALRKQLTALGEAERDRQNAQISAARRAVGQALWEVLDGPEGRLTRVMDDAEARGSALDLVVRLRTEDDAGSLSSHPAATWRFPLLSPSRGGHPSAEGRLRLVVQIGDVDPAATPRVLEHGGLRIVFMAYSPRGTTPLLDYEAEEERILVALERPLQERRARVQVVEDGTLAELERRLAEAPADVVHLTGHGIMTPDGPRLAMEDELGRRDDITPQDLLRVLKRAAKRPDLVVISSCHSAEARDGTPSFAAALVAGGMPAVLGWVQPVRDDVATKAAADLYRRLCGGETPAQAVAFVREQLRDADRSTPHPSHAWGTLHLLMRDARGFRVETEGTEPLSAPAMDGGALYRFLGTTGGMRVLERGFIGRRRPLQRLLRILRTGKDEDGTLVGGASVLGMKGVGKSCLVGRALERHVQDYGRTGLVVLHGVLDDVTVVQRFLEVAVQREDDKAEAILRLDEPVPRRIHRLLTGHWKAEPLVIVLDDFEKNLELRGDGDAVPSGQAAALLEVLLPACQGNRPKLLVTTTASFATPLGYERALAEVALGPFDPSTLRKLWMRLPEEDRKAVSPAAWGELAERLGRNARVLDWARTLLRGKTPEEAAEMARKAGEALPRWKSGTKPSDERVAELARLFLRTLAMEKASVELHGDALTFVKRARVYEWPVPVAAFEGLVDDLAVELGRDVTVLQNLGLLEVGEMDGQRAHRVSPLVEPDFEVDDAERWHAVAAAFWETASQTEGTGEQFERTMRAWEHALHGQCEDVAGRCGRRIDVVMNTRGLYGTNRVLARRHRDAFPEAEEGLLWAGSAEERAGDARGGWALYERGEALAVARGATGAELRRIMWQGSDILEKLGRFADAERRLQQLVDAEKKEDEPDKSLLARVTHSLAFVQQRLGKLSSAKANLQAAVNDKIEVYGTDEHYGVATSLHTLAGVLHAQGDLAGARATLERSLAIWAKVHGTDEHPSVAASLHALAQVLKAQGDLAGARATLERSLAIKAKVHGTDEHPSVAASLHALAGVLQAQGDLAGARATLERVVVIDQKVHGTDEHPSVAASLHALAQVLKAQGDLAGARATLERSLAIWAKVHGTDEHPDVAASLHALAGVLQAQGDLAGARATLERSLAIQAKAHGTDEHPSVAASLHALAGVLQAEGQPEDAVATYRRVLDIEGRVFGTLDQYHSAETEVSLGLLLLELNRHDEARELLSHAYAILGAQVPNHPAMTVLRRMFGDAPAVDPSQLARLALQARANGEAPPESFSQGLSAMAQAGHPVDVVATLLETIATGQPLPAPDSAYPEPVAGFVGQVLEVARSIDSAADSTGS